MPELPKLKILTVDDNRTNLQILQVFLRKLGHEAILAEDGERALALYEEHQPDLVLMDIMMPVMDGLEATRRIRALPSERWVPIIFLSALDRDENLVGGLDAGGDDYLSKPINFVVLEAKMRSMQRTLMLQQSVSDSLRRLQSISDNVLEALVTIDSRAIITSCNRMVEDLFGWPVDELVGQNVSVLCPEPHRSRHDDYVREYIAGGPPKVIGIGRTVTARHRSGREFPAELTISEVRLEGQRTFIGVIRDISERKRAEDLLRDNAEKLQRYYDASEAENQLATALIERQMMRKELDDPLIRYWLSPALHFSGDVLAAARGPDGRLYAMLADATGHGLTAAISTVPLLTLFYRLVRQAPTLGAMMSEINQQMRDAMPVGRFVAACAVCLDPAERSGEIWVGGMPTAFLLDDAGNVAAAYGSTALPLGIADSSAEEFQPVRFSWRGSCQLALYSDGLLEAANVAGEQFGEARLLQALRDAPAARRKEAMQDSLLGHLDTSPPQDDVSLLLLDCR
ncbi:SpoIIE family protein phosphatase [Azospira restricta]|uniref:Sensor protein FixL n=1 Tax=Azospira restricta TaxID=404405 RepID=A0A974Y524_9RHOO|nr:SpoIIE family protein phosphatase [Azospira restricta]QRJ64926.1 SpoIIE family protein phosphatase [Azospira restricta]